MQYTIKDRIYDILSITDPDDPVTEAVNGFIIALILINITAFFISIFTGYESQYPVIFWFIEVFSVLVFTAEYLLRLWVCTIEDAYSGPIAGRVKYATTNVLAVTDLLAILPFYIPLLQPVDLMFLRALRLLRVFRLFKLARYSDSMDIIEKVLIKQKPYLIITFIIQLLLLLISAGIMYYLEHDAQPERFSGIFDSLWWGLIPLTTVGYGDVYPVTPMGKLVSGILTFVGIIVMALPIGIISSGLEEEIKDVRRNARILKRRNSMEKIFDSIRHFEEKKRKI